VVREVRLRPVHVARRAQQAGAQEPVQRVLAARHRLHRIALCQSLHMVCPDGKAWSPIAMCAARRQDLQNTRQ